MIYFRFRNTLTKCVIALRKRNKCIDYLIQHQMSGNNTNDKRIIISSKHKNDIAAEFGVAVATVRMALKGFSDSDLTKKIRVRAKELLEFEASKIMS